MFKNSNTKAFNMDEHLCFVKRMKMKTNVSYSQILQLTYRWY